MRCDDLGRDLPFEVVTSVLYIVESSPTDRVTFADFVATIRAALCVLPIWRPNRRIAPCTFCCLLSPVCMHRMYGEFIARAETVFRACVCDSMSGMSTRCTPTHRSKHFALAGIVWG
jgi:hypothetical protein